MSDIIGLIQTVADTLIKLHDVIEKMKDAPHQLKLILQETMAFDKCLNRLTSLEPLLSCRGDKKVTLETYLNVAECHDTVMHLKTFVHDLTPLVGMSVVQDLRRRVSFLFKQDDLEKLRKRLSTQKDDVTMALSLIASENILATKAKLDQAIEASKPVIPFQVNSTFKSTSNSTTKLPYRLVWLSEVQTSPTFSPQYIRDRERLSDAAYVGNWNALFSMLQYAQATYHQNWINVGRLVPHQVFNSKIKPSGFTPLHQAAFKGAPVSIIQELISLGASRTSLTIRSPFADMTPLDLARSTGRTHLYDALCPVLHHTVPCSILQQLEVHLHQLLKQKCPHLQSPHHHRLPQLSPLTEFREIEMFMPIMTLDNQQHQHAPTPTPTPTSKLSLLTTSDWKRETGRGGGGGDGAAAAASVEVGCSFQLDGRELLVKLTYPPGSSQMFRIAASGTREIYDAVMIHR